MTFDVAVHLRECQITFTGPNNVYPIAIGEMNPSEEPSGVRKRLQHLGYGADVEDETSDHMTTDAQDMDDGFPHPIGRPLLCRRLLAVIMSARTAPKLDSCRSRAPT